jgi:lysophospholipase L1-like esterase
MRFSTVLCTLAAALTQALPTANHQKELPPYFILTGDSTTAVNGGWGDGFLRFLQNTTGGVNIGKSGATTVSFRSGGYWAKAIQAVKDQKCNYRPIVTIQFGHNDQKAEANITLAQFQANMEQLAREVISAGGTPVSHIDLWRNSLF